MAIKKVRRISLPGVGLIGITVVVFGGRNYQRRAKVFEVLDDIHAKRGIRLVIEGGARGADRLGRVWARERLGEQGYKTYAPDWDDITVPGAVVRYHEDGTPYNVVAGHQRNQQMITEGKPDLAIGFPGGNGTQDMWARVKAAKIPYLEVED